MGGACSLASERQQENDLNVCTRGLQQWRRRVFCLCACVGFKPGTGERCGCLRLLAPATGQGSVELALGWESINAATAHTCQSQPGDGVVLQPPALAQRLWLWSRGTL